MLNFKRKSKNNNSSTENAEKGREDDEKSTTIAHTTVCEWCVYENSWCHLYESVGLNGFDILTFVGTLAISKYILTGVNT